MSQNDIDGYIVAYDQDEIQFPVYLVFAVGAVLIATAAVKGNIFLFALGVAALGYGYHNVPLLETGKPRLGAGQHGIFVDGLGVIGWRSVKQVDLIPVDSRGVAHAELHIALNEPLDRALIADWRRRPLHRIVMRLPWSMADDGIVRVPLDVFDQPADEIHSAVVRMLLFYRR